MKTPFRGQATIWFLALILLAGNMVLEQTARTAQINVPVDYSTIQAAINAANAGDVINIAAGQYNEGLTITQSLSLVGSGTNNCIVYYTNTPMIVTITGPGTVQLSNFEINGGQLGFGGWYYGSASQGIVATNVNLILNNMLLNQVRNYFVTVTDGTLYATNVTLFTRGVLQQCDVGFELVSCTGAFYNLCQDAGQIDHTIDVNNLATKRPSTLTIDHCRIASSLLTWGNCVRTYVDSYLTITNCLFYRAQSYSTPDTTNYTGGSHNGVGINGYSNSVMIVGNTFSNVPWAIYCYGSPGMGGNQVIVQNNTIVNSLDGGVLVDGMQYRGIDLGGGNLGSQGNNSFSQTLAALTNYVADIFMSTNAASISTTNIFALHNIWSNSTNKESVIYDKLDNAILGRVITDDLLIKAVGVDGSNKAILRWNERGAGEKYTIQWTDNLMSGVWSNSPGVWPIQNPSLQNDMCWTNSTPNSSKIFYRVRSLVP